MRPFAVAFALVSVLSAVDLDRDFSGNWILVEDRSRVRGLNDPEPFLKITQDATAIHCETDGAKWSYFLDGRDSKFKLGAEQRNAALKWEGAALLVNVLVSGPTTSYTIMDRWRLSPDRTLLTITRQVVGKSGEVEGALVYRRAGTHTAEMPAPSVMQPPTPQPPVPVLTPRPAPTVPAPEEAVVTAGTHVLLELVNSLNVKRSKDGDRVYLRTAVPVAAGGRVVIPRGSNVLGTVVEVKKPKGKGDLYIRFDTLTLPRGQTFDLRARPEDRNEGRIGAAPDHAKDTRTVATGAGIGASIGTLAGAAAGHTVAGMGIGGLAGAAVGLASVLSKRQDITLHPGTQVDMVVDRDLKF
jgi:hypothetical protein